MEKQHILNWSKATVLAFAYAATSIFAAPAAHGQPSAKATAMAMGISQGPMLVDEVQYGSHVMRTGLYLETGSLKGCVLYLEGLGDSIRNHEPLFRALSDHGYRTVSFDYFGQGGSSGAMNETRLSWAPMKSREIRQQAKFFWSHFSSVPDPVRGLTCAGQKRLVIGWSTGGLAAYQLANERWADGVILIAPGIHANVWVGAAAENSARLWTLDRVITKRSLTRATTQGFSGVGYDPHIDPIKPDNPMKAPLFATNLLLTSLWAQNYKISPSVKGLVFLSGPDDSYVDGVKTRATLKANAPHFKTVTYASALHEIDNEVKPVQSDLIKRTLEFLAAF